MNANEQAELKQFLNFVATNGYGNEATKKHRQSDGSDTIELADGDWKFHDNYFTSSDGRSFFGREVVFKAGKPYWYMGYAGFTIADAEPSEVDKIIGTAMLSPDEDTPIRGPLELTLGDWQYAFTPGDSLDEFYAAEWIKHNGTNVYLAHLHGGLIA
ncbi:hypothetical protein HJC99_00025 [Candidatus Saccharibacteria bacterium]|nr:hypothetical protein [Candidatus Saccharibacteria bacterium]